SPVLDVKPYIPYADAIATAEGAWATHHEPPIPVRWSDHANACLNEWYGNNSPENATLRCLIAETIAQDPRPAHERGKDGEKGQEWNLQVFDVSVFWSVAAGIATITRLVKPTGDDSDWMSGYSGYGCG
ncbi:MAG: hypothetical protein F6K36_30915, partial [Symploca sp. SIO3C6]|nr:hypothetical protein [Symploca sp. SIO3C6]